MVSMKQIALVALLISIIPIYLTVQAIQASIDFWLEKKESFTTGTSSITIYCKNGGEIDGDFYLVVTFFNAAFSNQTAKPFVYVDNTTAKFPFVLHKGESSEKSLNFSVGENTNEFSITLSLEKMNLLSILKANAMYPNELHYGWDASTSQFVLIE